MKTWSPQQKKGRRALRPTAPGALPALGKSPGLARHLTDLKGVAFGHISLGEGRIDGRKC